MNRHEINIKLCGRGKMGSRYFITGTQLGIILAELKYSSLPKKSYDFVQNMIENIMKEQYIGEKEDFIPPFYQKSEGKVELKKKGKSFLERKK